jgi:hypothetical protein
MENNISDDELEDAFRPKTNKEQRVVDKIKRNESIYGKDFYNKPERHSLKILKYHIQRIKEGKSIRFDMEEVFLPTSIIIALCESEGINYKTGKKNGKVCILYIGDL